MYRDKLQTRSHNNIEKIEGILGYWSLNVLNIWITHHNMKASNRNQKASCLFHFKLNCSTYSQENRSLKELMKTIEQKKTLAVMKSRFRLLKHTVVTQQSNRVKILLRHYTIDVINLTATKKSIIIRIINVKAIIWVVLRLTVEVKGWIIKV